LKGNKVDQKLYRHHTRYPGGLREITAREMIAKRPERVIELAIRGMLPKNKLGKAMAKKLKIYADAEHPHFSSASASLSANSPNKSTINKKQRDKRKDYCG